eukprot:NODE_376_length_8513_cov_1.020086.p3 type:complete len:317 gc:universal NODE_376_length_8513_cov_1.020086:3868-2918(-)
MFPLNMKSTSPLTDHLNPSMDYPSMQSPLNDANDSPTKSYSQILQYHPFNRSQSLSSLNQSDITKALSNMSLQDPNPSPTKYDRVDSPLSDLNDEDPMKRQRSKSIVLGMPSIWSDKKRTSSNPVRRHSLHPTPVAQNTKMTHALSQSISNGYANLINPSLMDIQPIHDIGHGKSLNSFPNEQVFYLVEFKGGRSDVFYYMGELMDLNTLVIVEGDRGKDLGKILQNTLSKDILMKLSDESENEVLRGLLTDLHKVNHEIHPRQIYRMAQPSEVTMLITKSQEEMDALQYCMKLTSDMGLPMTVVDCEYQWYFIFI